ncbi:transporter, solute:sodium symporter (SSS) family protein [Toxoplasma gondii TgCatPRC2]|uniref:Sodium:solute symporter family domain-containing protein n=14 Tax=Toxoplasma gondii TaxID=5811 RepID=B9PZ26_TOXGV|nr:transporter, solute:sodium symporter (SSS) family protein [Toxoplasma gondii GT1]ESS29035.1 transporter, solute:sodium symporter (SSS) family protein [Toxoplasma gondii VEG]KAF4644695.1 transporter, solute:sodium symporter (SSS) family protein [Toxoplasma gondii]KFG28434.1 transporter, solute:sodium symporter (SSS) family protein [Toxoplasma gondii p89]KFG33241.1 transporter, solute:sodium symporter (SSS) family protein [Toxoplasma gondii GAB2-2007-GAL-DOM2]KFG45462.1 transporter, solute:so
MAYLDLPVAYSLLYSTVAFFALVVFVLEGRLKGRFLATVKESLFHPSEDLLSSRGKHGWFPLCISLVASFMGNWVLYLPPDVGAQYGWPGITGYAFACGLPYVLLLWFAPHVKRLTLTDGFSGTDYLLSRYGRLVQAAATTISLLYMFFALSGELTTVGVTMNAVTNGAFPVFAGVIPVAVVTLAYTTYGGLRASILTDVYQGLLVVGLVVPLLIIVFSTARDNMFVDNAATVAAPSGYSQYIAGGVFLFSIWPSFLLDQGIWQRVWAARSLTDIRIAFAGAAFVAFSCVFLFGMVGIACRDQALSQAMQRQEENVSIFGYLAETLPAGWVGVLTVLAITCVASSADTYQTALAVVFAQDLLRSKRSFNWARVLIVLLNIPAILVASLQLDLLTLNMTANVLCVVAAGPLLASVHEDTNSVGMVLGFCISLLAFFTCGWISTGDFMQGLAFIAPVDFSDTPYLVAFVVVPVLGAVTAITTSCVYTCIRHRFFPGGSCGLNAASVGVEQTGMPTDARREASKSLSPTQQQQVELEPPAARAE